MRTSPVHIHTSDGLGSSIISFEATMKYEKKVRQKIIQVMSIISRFLMGELCR